MKTVIILDEEWRIESRPLNFVLLQTKISYGKGKNASDTPRLVTTCRGHYNSVLEALQSFLTKYVDDKTADFEGTLPDYIARIKNLMDSALEKIAKGVKQWGKG